MMVVLGFKKEDVAGILLRTLYVGSIIVHSFFSRSIVISIYLLSSLVFVFSIFFIFYIVALSIFATSRFVSTLYLNEVKRNGFSTTNLHLLLRHYKFGVTLTLISIFYFLFLIFLYSHENTFLFMDFCFYFVIPFVIHNFISVYSSLNRLIKVVKQDAKMSICIERGRYE